MSFALFVEQILNGLVQGAVYALVGAGLALIYGTMRILNLSQGEFFMLGGYATYVLVAEMGLPPLGGIAGAVLLGAAAAGLVHRLTVAPLHQREGWEFNTIALTLGVSIVLQNIAFHLWGERFKTVEYFVEGSLRLGELRMPWQRLLILAASVAVIALAAAVLKYTRFGRALRATAQDAEAAQAMGIDTTRIHAWTFVLAGGLGALAAALLSPLAAVNPWMGNPFMLKAFVVVVLGGLGSFGGAIAGGFVLGVVESIGLSLTSSEWRDVISFSVLIAILWLRPAGLFATSTR
ncbi:branched-chain amino acid ABC transporter permease [Variovorax sp. LjRoot84]|uniref:branched-chain amino acid ABC transporter permease n=1 Tax=Variovorax sp. LjRoot84 TaxID=3342340 RepID=UPI003ECCCC76